MRKIKRLKLFMFMEKEWMVVDCNYEQVDPVFFKSGIFLQGEKCWFENEYQGIWKAYKYNLDQFKYELSLLDVELGYNINQINVLKECIKQKVASKEQIKTVRLWNEAHECIKIKRNSRLVFKRFQKKLNNSLVDNTKA